MAKSWIKYRCRIWACIHLIRLPFDFQEDYTLCSNERRQQENEEVQNTLNDCLKRASFTLNSLCLINTNPYYTVSKAALNGLVVERGTCAPIVIGCRGLIQILRLGLKWTSHGPPIPPSSPLLPLNVNMKGTRSCWLA